MTQEKRAEEKIPKWQKEKMRKLELKRFREVSVPDVFIHRIGNNFLVPNTDLQFKLYSKDDELTRKVKRILFSSDSGVSYEDVNDYSIMKNLITDNGAGNMESIMRKMQRNFIPITVLKFGDRTVGIVVGKVMSQKEFNNILSAIA